MIVLGKSITWRRTVFNDWEIINAMMPLTQIHFETIDSTNTWAKSHCEEFDPGAITVVTAEEQTAGRGRWKRSWLSPRGVSIYATYCFFLKSHRQDIGNIPQVLSLSAAHVLRELDIPVLIKWPNDLILHKKKLGGILCETVVSSQGVHVIVGIGVNVNVEQKDLDLVDRPAISLYTATGKKFEIASLQEALNKQFQTDLAHFLDKGFEPFYPTYQALSTLSKGTPITVNIYPKKYVGAFEVLRSDGSLVLRSEDGTLHTYHSGEILE